MGTNAFVLMVAAVQLAVALKSPTHEPPRVDIEVPAPLLADPAFTIAVDNWVRDAMRLGGRVTLRVPDAPPLEIVQDYARGRVASQPTRLISKKLIGRTGPDGLFTAPITRLSEDFTVTYHTVERKGFLAELVLPERGGPAKAGPRTRTVFVVWDSKAPSPQVGGAPLTVQGRLIDPESVRLQRETPAAVERADGAIVVEAAQTWM